MRAIRLDELEMSELMRGTAGQGGWQSLIGGLQDKLNPQTGVIHVSDEDIERIRRYAFDYGNGGWEGRLRKIFQQHLGADLNG